MRGKLIWLPLVASLLSGCLASTLNRSESLNPSGLFEADSDIGRTFESATVVLPQQLSDDRSSAEPFVGTMGREDEWTALVERLQRPMPVVLFLHGCTGLRNLEPLKALARAGFAVIAPDSFSRRFRPLQCRPSERRGGENIYVYDFRLAEVSYALHRLAALPWVDHSKLILMGVSEGGVAAALYRGDEFRARVITQWTCHGRPFVRGLAAGPQEAVLAIVRAKDPWYDSARTKDQQGHCGVFFGNSDASESLILDGGSKHDVFDEPSVIRKIVNFLEGQV